MLGMPSAMLRSRMNNQVWGFFPSSPQRASEGVDGKNHLSRVEVSGSLALGFGVKRFHNPPIKPQAVFGNRG